MTERTKASAAYAYEVVLRVTVELEGVASPGALSRKARSVAHDAVLIASRTIRGAGDVPGGGTCGYDAKVRRVGRVRRVR